MENKEKVKEVRDAILTHNKVKNDNELKDYVNQLFKEKLNIPITKSLDDLSWDEIAEISKNGDAEKYFKIGDTKKFQLYTGELCEAVIIGFNVDALDGVNKMAGITFALKDLLDGEFEMNDSNTNIGGWRKSKMRNVYMPRFYKLLPKDLRGVIKSVLKETDDDVTVDKLFLPSFNEVFGIGYPYFTNETNRIKNRCDKPAIWWLRTSFAGSCTYSLVVIDGSPSDNFASLTYGVSFCFAI